MPKVKTSYQDNVVSLPKRLTGTEAIVAEVTELSKRQNEKTLQLLQETVAAFRARKRDRANELIVIGMKMDMPMMMDFIEIGQRMIESRGRA